MTTVLEPTTTTDTTTDAAPTDAAAGTAAVVRVVKGHLAAEELAALTAVLLARAANQPGSGGFGKAQDLARWQRPERRIGYNSPVSWHS
ncbi:acyl-CoA carboxylase epsilon subunit [Streptacidiphilus sp. EB129]|uniref:acyl-CoA carboxylase epsilon subunit n=1 Tax=Streptacidiphilus sp. EB129 TaxID=3156262 RepID=UPI0035192E66